MLPYGIGQEVEFKKDFGPLLGSIDDIDINKIGCSNAPSSCFNYKKLLI